MAIVKRRNYFSDEGFADATIKQLTNLTYSMTGYLCMIDEENGDDVAKMGQGIANEWNKFAKIMKNKMEPITYRGDVTSDDEEAFLQSLDHYMITKEVVNFAKNYFSEEIAAGCFYEDTDTIRALFGRKENNRDVEMTMGRYE